MKDSYSFDRDEAGLDRSFQAHEGAYDRIFERCGLETHFVEAESGMHGRQRVVRLPRAGRVGREHARHLRERRLRGRPRGRARRAARAAFPERLGAPEEIETPGMRDDRGARAAARHRLAATSKAMPVVAATGTLVLGLLRGDDRLEYGEAASALGSDFRPATDEEIRAAFGADPARSARSASGAR